MSSAATDDDAHYVCAIGFLGEGRSSFLKKRTKKLLFIWLSPSGKAEAETDERFLLLFFKKEDLSFAPQSGLSMSYHFMTCPRRGAQPTRVWMDRDRLKRVAKQQDYAIM